MCVQSYRRGLEWDMTTVRRRCDNIVYCVVYDCPFRKIDNLSTGLPGVLPDQPRLYDAPQGKIGDESQP